jgi:purine nucleosidase
VRLVIDTDTGSDDAVALMLALAADGVRVEAVTTVAGNVPLEAATRNALVTCALMGSGVPVHRGAARPLLRPLQTAQHVHGPDGLSGVAVPAPARGPAGDDAVDVLVDAARSAPGELTLVTLGPLTNVAAALLRDPRALARYRAVYCMAGAPEGRGNVSAGAEYNVWADPEAARVVLRGGTPVTLVGWNVCRTRAVVTPDDERSLLALGTARARFAVAVNTASARWARGAGHAGFVLPDPLAVLVALDPSVVTAAEDASVDVVLGDEPGRGVLVIDRRHVAPPPNATVVWDVRPGALLERLTTVCADPSDPAGFATLVR